MSQCVEIRQPTTGTDRLICRCFQVRESAIREAMDIHGVRDVSNVTACTGAGGGCRGCHCRIQRVLAGLPVHCGPGAVCEGCGCIQLLCQCQAA